MAWYGWVITALGAYIVLYFLVVFVGVIDWMVLSESKFLFNAHMCIIALIFPLIAFCPFVMFVPEYRLANKKKKMEDAKKPPR
ncbi:MAG: hypothetical protein G01um101419_240 [Parcubacteria group bacterium Gr01-1014_19]|nr:MAG: hypothetical protein G01um101419_240 [Parcubacteria group bacterium Gr01-1014_19]